MDFTDIKLWIFDCDGVLLDSNAMKTNAFSEILSSYSKEYTKPFLTFQKTAFGMSRFRTIDMFFSDYLKRSPMPDEKERLLDHFAHYCRQNYPQQSVTEGTSALLNRIKQKGVPIYVASGSEQEELRNALTQIGLAPYFQDILGSPRKKHEIIADILERENHVPLDHVVFFGDAKADLEAADINGIPFVQVKRYAADPEGMAHLCSTRGFPSIATLAEISC